MKIKLFTIVLVLSSFFVQQMSAADTSPGKKTSYVQKSQENIQFALRAIKVDGAQGQKLKAAKDDLTKSLDAIDREYEKKHDAQLSYLFDLKGFKKNDYIKLMNEKEKKVQETSLRYFEEIYKILNKEQLKDFNAVLKQNETK